MIINILNKIKDMAYLINELQNLLFDYWHKKIIFSYEIIAIPANSPLSNIREQKIKFKYDFGGIPIELEVDLLNPDQIVPTSNYIKVLESRSENNSI